MDPNLRDQAQDKLTRAESIQITIDPATGFDGLATGLALYLSCTKLGKNVSVSAKEPTVGEAQMLYAIDKIGKSQSQKNLVITIDNAVEKVDQVSYFLEGNKLKVVVHSLPGAEPIYKNEIEMGQESKKADLVFTIGGQMNTESTLEQNKDTQSFRISISRTPLKQNIAQLQISNPEAASISEIATLLFQELALPVDEDISYNLYQGISTATDKFSPAIAKPLSFQAASWLIKFGPGKTSFATSQSLPKNIEPDIIQEETITYPTLGATQGKDEIMQTPLEQVEREKGEKSDWLKPPKIYKGSKSFDSE